MEQQDLFSTSQAESSGSEPEAQKAVEGEVEETVNGLSGKQDSPESPEGVQKKLLLIDGFNFLYRSHHAMLKMGRSFNSPDGTPTGALLTFLNMVESLKKTFKPDAVAIVFESPSGTFRDKLFEEYKAQRPPTPDDLKVQINLVKKLCPLMGLPVVYEDGFEADDLLCAYGVDSEAKGWKVILATSDKDINQSVSDNVGVWDPNLHKDSNTVHTPESVMKKFGVPPKLIPSYLALMGDSVDNIPGVDGVGTKTAAKLLNKYESIEGILSNLSDLSESQQEAFKRAEKHLPMALELSTARLDAPLKVSVTEMEALNKNANWTEALKEFERLAFRAWIDKARKHLGLPALPKPEKKPKEPKASTESPEPRVSAPKP